MTFTGTITVDLADLAQLPHGHAAKALAQAGLWDPDADKPYCAYRVELGAEIVVKARSSDEAQDIAGRMIGRGEVDPKIDLTPLSADLD